MQIPTDTYDCIFINEFLHHIDNVAEYIDLLVKKLKPRIIIAVEPRPSKTYQSPNYSELFDSWAWVAKPLTLDIDMGHRVVYTFFTDKNRPNER